MKTTDFAFQLTKYFNQHLISSRNISQNTIESYRITFKLLMIYCRDECKISVHKVSFSDLTDGVIRAFLEWLETKRGNGMATINQRLAAIHAFYRYLQTEVPDHMLLCQRILIIPYKKQTKPLIGYLTPKMLSAILAMPNTHLLQGRRDLTLLSLLYDTAARVQELCDLRLRDLRLYNPAIVTLTGKGSKSRNVPIMVNTVSLLKIYIKDWGLDVKATPDHPLFFNQRHFKMTRTGVSFIVQKYADLTRSESDLVPEKVTPHIFRHTKAMHLYQSGIDLIYIRDILGHADIKTTQIYAQIDTELKREALEKVYPELIPNGLPDWNNDSDLMSKLLKL
jgi:integrase/recombinase XerD